ncbi:MAG TPA: hypothetical protein DCE44_13655 [Verrucomicrobiales bacterium]|nr:hypothetical protein [Verrucomicrobiales bacterium]
MHLSSHPRRRAPISEFGLKRMWIWWVYGFAALTLVSARADSLDDWSAAFLRALKAENNTPPLGARSMAMYSLAVADAVNAVERRWKPYAYQPTNSTTGASVDAAVTAAAYRMGLALFPSRRADFEALWNREQTNLPSGPAREAGFQLGFASAAAILEARMADGSNTQIPYIPTNAPGAWRRTPPWFRPPDLPHWGLVKPFALTRPDQFRPPGPPALTSAQYLSDYNEVKAIGAKNSATRTADQTLAANFWSDFSGTVTPPGHWTQITLAISQSNSVPLVDKARLLALVHIALADAGIACWDTKYAYNFWRPVTAAIRVDDGNPLTEPDPKWESLLPAPSFPDYVSGHSTFTGAGGQILRRWFKRDDLPFSITSDTVKGVSRSYHSLSNVVQEIGMSRIWGGIHFHSADVDGQELGRRVADWVFEHELQLLPAAEQKKE